MKKVHRQKKGKRRQGFRLRQLAAGALVAALCLTGLAYMPGSAQAAEEPDIMEESGEQNISQAAGQSVEGTNENQTGGLKEDGTYSKEEAEAPAVGQNSGADDSSQGDVSVGPASEDTSGPQGQEEGGSDNGKTEKKEKETGQDASGEQDRQASIDKVMELSREGRLTKSVIEDELGGTIYSESQTSGQKARMAAPAANGAARSVVENAQISLGYFTIKCDTAADNTDLKDAVRKELGHEYVSPGAVNTVFPELLDYNNSQHILERVSVTPQNVDGGEAGSAVDVYYIGVLEIGDVQYVYYVTDEKLDDMTVYSVLEPNSADKTDAKKIHVEYRHTTAYDISYEIQDSNGTIQNGMYSDSEGITYNLDQVFGADRVTAAEVGEDGNTAGYVLNVQIPRGYQAEVLVYDLKDGQIDGSPQTLDTLGKMLEYKEDPEGVPLGNESVVPVDENQTFALSGSYEVDNVTSDQKVVVKYTKIDTYKFTANAWLQTRFVNGNAQSLQAEQQGGLNAGKIYNRVGDPRVEEPGTDKWSPYYDINFSGTIEDHKYTWSFIGRTDADDITWSLDALEINGEAVKVPIVAAKSSDTVVTETTLSTGTIVKISVYFDPITNSEPGSSSDTIYGDGGNEAVRRVYTVEFSNCYENITVTGGNMVGHTHQELVIEELHGIKDNVVEAYNNQGQWVPRKQSELVNQMQEYTKGMPLRFKRASGYFEPSITVTPKNGIPAFDDEAVQYLRLKSGYTENEEGEIVSVDTGETIEINGTADIITYFDEVSHDDLHGGESASVSMGTEHYHYFYIKKAFTDEMDGSANSIYNQLRITVTAKYIKGAVRYISGAAEDGKEGPSEASISNVPYDEPGDENINIGIDYGGSTGYNNENNNLVPVANTVPVSEEGWVFKHWVVVKVEGNQYTTTPHEVDGQPVTFSPGSATQIDSMMEDTELHGCFEYPESDDGFATVTLMAVWEKAQEGDPVNYFVNYYLNDNPIYGANYTAELNAKLVIDIYNEAGDFSDAIQNVLAGGNDSGTNYTESGIPIVLDKVGVTGAAAQGEQPFSADQIANANGVIVGTLLSNNTNNIINIYLKTEEPSVDIKVRKAWEGEGLNSVQIQLQRKAGTNGDWTDVSGGAVSLSNSNNWSHTFQDELMYEPDTANNVKYEYRVVELDNKGDPIEDGDILAAGAASYIVTYGGLIKDEDQSETNHEVYECTVTNSRQAALMVEKQVDGDYGNTEKQFTIKITLKDGQGKPISGEYTTDSSGKVVFDVNGEAEVTLKDSDSITIRGLAPGSSYTVQEELPPGSEYTASYYINYSDDPVKGNCAEGILSNGDANVRVVNTRGGVPDSGIGSLGTPGILAVGIVLLGGMGGTFLLYRRSRRYRR